MYIFFDKHRRLKGQVAVVLILFVALGLILYAATGNLGRASQSKVLTLKASNAAASQMASLLASYGEQLLVEQLGRQTKSCKTKGNVWRWLVDMAWMALMIYLMPYAFSAAVLISGGKMPTVSGGTFDFSTMSMTYIDPAIEDLWNSMTNENLSALDQFVESGVQTALRGAITDSVQIPDFEDLDQDLRYVTLPFDPWTYDLDAPTSDNISRFALYNTRRLEPQNIDSDNIKAFLRALKNFIYTDDTSIPDPDGPGPHTYFDWPASANWGLFDPVDCSRNPAHPCCPVAGNWSNVPSICNPCCLPEEYMAITPSELGGVPTMPPAARMDAPQPTCCQTAPGGSCGDPQYCQDNTLYYDLNNPDPDKLYHWVYEPFTEDSNFDLDPDLFISFSERLGRDDENRYYFRDPNASVDYLSPQTLSAAPGMDQYSKGDTSGFYQGFGGYRETRETGIFTFLWKMRDWGVELSSLNYTNFVAGPADDEQCHWCDKTTGGSPYDPITSSPGCEEPVPDTSFELIDLVLPVDPTLPGTYSGGWCVDRANRAGALETLPQKFDIVGNLDSLMAGPAECVTDPGDYVNIGWKEGLEMFCSVDDSTNPPDVDLFPDYPYYATCPQHTDPGDPECFEILADTSVLAHDCLCSEAADSSLFSADYYDQLIEEMKQFFLEAQELLEVPPDTAAALFGAWYESVAEWIEPICTDHPDCTDDPYGASCNCPWSYTKKERQGTLFYWRDFLTAVSAELQNWIDGPYVSSDCANDGTPDSVWCVPPEKIGNRVSVDTNGATGGVNYYDLDECAGVISDEQASFEDGTLPAARGDLYDVVSCLNWNIGNAGRFFGCDNALNQYIAFYRPGTFPLPIGPLPFLWTPLQAAVMNACNNLPRSLLPGFSSVVSGEGPMYRHQPNSLANPWAGLSNSVNGNYLTPPYLALVDPADILAFTPLEAFEVAVRDSYTQARNQSVKFAKRRNFLSNRLTEAQNLLDAINEAINEITAFLDAGTAWDADSGTGLDKDSPAEQLIYDRSDPVVMDDISSRLPSTAIYVWRDEGDPDAVSPVFQQGAWHAVKVEVRLPKRCNLACNADGSTGVTQWPEIGVSVKKHTFSTKICYFMENKQGRVKARVIRWDQVSPSANLVNFPGGMQLWKLRLSHPDFSAVGDPQNLASGTCFEQVDPLLQNTPWEDAFMLNDPPPLDPILCTLGVDVCARDPSWVCTSDNDCLESNGGPGGKCNTLAYCQCWKRVHELLRYGVASDTCAEYYLGDASSAYNPVNAFRMRFVECDAGFLDGAI